MGYCEDGNCPECRKSRAKHEREMQRHIEAQRRDLRASGIDRFLQIGHGLANADHAKRIQGWHEDLSKRLKGATK